MSTMLQLRNPFEAPFDQRPRPIAIHTTGSPRSEHTNTTSPSASMGPPSNNSPEVEQRMDGMNGSSPQHLREHGHVGAAAVSAAQGPKVVQTAFIHKLYSMLEDKSIEHLISWSNNGDSFVMSPSNEFSKVLAQYFKHTNISSFVRQLNMYGFHKVSDVFHTGSSESALWEFRHGNGNFKKGDLLGLREIKRRASRHTLIHRDSFTSPAPKPGPSQPGTPAEIIPDTDSRLTYLESMLHDMYSRLSRTEDSYALMSSRCQNLTENIGKCHQWIGRISRTMNNALPPESSLRGDLVNVQKEVERQQDLLRAAEAETPPNGHRQGYYSSNMSLEPPVSPRGYAFGDSRRSSIQMSDPPPPFSSRPPVPPVPPQFSSSSPRRFGSTSAAHTSPGFSKPPLPNPSQPHPLSNVSEPPPNLARRHTSADIREHWPPNTNGSPFASGIDSVQWQPSSPHQQPETGSDRALQNQLASYQINSSRRGTITAADAPDSIPLAHRDSAHSAGLGVGNMSWGVGVSKFPRPNFDLHSAPATRRSSMASNVHSLLNPADTAEQENEDGGGLGDDRKRKRLV
ncbi:Flocculation suppression protein [Exophiala xenobiotica]|uniref:Flocculation suppression protein n=1 Tax=Lithohypha guttulata TaxID=1690604 RepID=A0ABR0K5U6_9EURO|nr:Flocculation suppression protein [Lithohypha guttulata]KAK5314856.1 Flocculation suppression protein [Exophiala xenobiotica]